MAETTIDGPTRSRRPKAPDFPFYDGQPIALSAGRWLFLLGMAAAGCAGLFAAPHLWPGQAGRWIGVLLFAGLPLIGLRLAAGRQWTALFRWPRPRDVLIGLAFVPATMAVSGLAALGIMRVSLTGANPSTALLEKLDGVDRALFLTSTLPQLFGEELVTIVPLLALLTAFHHGLKLSRRVSLILAWTGSAVIFAALHLSTYQWHVVQTLTVIGVSRLMLTAPYLITRNAWSSVVTHVTNDWLMFGFALWAATQG